MEDCLHINLIDIVDTRRNGESVIKLGRKAKVLGFELATLQIMSGLQAPRSIQHSLFESYSPFIRNLPQKLESFQIPHSKM